MASEMRKPRVGTKLWGIKSDSFDDEKHTMVVVANSGQVDRVGEILDPEGCDYENFMLNPVFLWGHDDRSFPIGKINKVWIEEEEGILEEVQLAVEEYEEAAIAWKLFRGGYLNAVSVRFMSSAWEDYAIDSDAYRETGCMRKYTAWELLETSAVNIPCDALALRKALDEDPAELERLLKQAMVTRPDGNGKGEGPVSRTKQDGPAGGDPGIPDIAELTEAIEWHVRTGVAIDLEGDGPEEIIERWKSAKEEPAADAPGLHIFGPESDRLFVGVLELLRTRYLGSSGKDPNDTEPTESTTGVTDG